MRTVLALAMVAAAGSGVWADRLPQQAYITLDRDALATAHGISAEVREHMHVLRSEGPAAIVVIDADDLDALSHAMHEHHDRCGGFMVHESLADARDAMKPMPVDRSPSYTIDRPAAVHAALPRLDRERIATTIRELSAMHNRYYRSESGAAASTWLRDRWRSFTDRADVTFELIDHGYAQKSVVMTIP
ncbi:MAG: hypothetical protein AB7L28_26060, partial [Kofleriaceae bacterium]